MPRKRPSPDVPNDPQQAQRRRVSESEKVAQQQLLEDVITLHTSETNCKGSFFNLVALLRKWALPPNLTSRPHDSIEQVLFELREMTPLSKTMSEFQEIGKYLEYSKADVHKIQYTVQDIFRVRRDEDDLRFPAPGIMWPYQSDRRLLWHGSPIQNFHGILSQGLQIAPEGVFSTTTTERTFGKGIYFADRSTKAVQHCEPHLAENTALLLLCEVELMRPCIELDRAIFKTPTSPGPGNFMPSVYGKGKCQAAAWKDANCVHPSVSGVKMPKLEGSQNDYIEIGGAGTLFFDEFVVYSVEQVKLRYLVRVNIESLE
ncbi:MAG: hypothetical protein Q9227_002928 [Pyrenula ochraceoflavens]